MILSLKECRMFVESVFLNEGGGFISTGLGGKGNKLRYYFIVSKRSGRPLTETEKETAQEAIEASSAEYEAELEEFTIESNYVMVRILVPMDVAVGRVIEEGIDRCNRKREVLSRDYYVTNVKKPAQEEILEYLKEIKKEEN